MVAIETHRKDGEENCNEDVTEAVKKLKILVSEKYENLQLPPDGDNILERCLRRRNFNLTEAANQVDLFFKLFSELGSAKKGYVFTPSSHKSYFFDSFGFVLLKQRDIMGRRIIWLNYDPLPADAFSLDDGLAVAILIMNELTRVSVEDQKNGVVYVFNMNSMRFGHVKQYNLARVKAIIKVMQGAIPVRIKAYHLLNSPAIFSYAYSLFKPLLKNKIKNRIIFHGSDLTDFYKDVERKALPDCMGGDLPIEECVDAEFMHKMCAGDNYYKELLRYGYST